MQNICAGLKKGLSTPAASADGLPGKGLNILQIVDARDLTRAQRGGVRIQNLTIHQPALMFHEMLAKYPECGFRGVLAAAEHRLAAENLPEREAVHAADQLLILPDFDGVRMTQLLETLPGALYFEGDPGAFLTTGGAAFHHLEKGVIHGDAVW